MANKPDGIGSEEGYLDRNAKLVPSDPSTMALTSAAWVAGHHTVLSKSDLLSIKSFTLSPTTYGTYISGGEDAIGQLWYVQNENAFYQLISWTNRAKESGWSKTNLKAATNPDGSVVSETTKTDIGWLTGITVNGDGKLFNSNSPLAKKETTSVAAYTSGESTFKIPVVTYIGIGSDGKTIDYTTYSYTLLSQAHHGGSKEGDFLTKVSLSSTGTLSGVNGVFSNESLNSNWDYANATNASYMVNDNDNCVVTYTYIDKTGKTHSTYAKIPPIVSDVTFKQESDTVYTYFCYASGSTISKTGYPATTNIATGENHGLPIVSYDGPGLMMPTTYSHINTTYDYIEDTARDWITDIEERLTGTYTLKNIGSISHSIKWTRYKADGTTKYSDTSTSASLSALVGDWVEAEYTGSWSRTTNSATVTSTSGDWGTSAVSTDPSSTGGTFTTKTYSKKQITSRGTTTSIGGNQTINWFRGTTAKSLVISNGKLQKQDGQSVSGSCSVGNFTYYGGWETCRWYGATSINPATATADELNTLMSGSTLSKDKSWQKNFSGKATTSATNKYWIYIFPIDYTISQASIPGADATKWFSMDSSNTCSYTMTNGYAFKYRYIYTLNENALSAGPTLTLS